MISGRDSCYGSASQPLDGPAGKTWTSGEEVAGEEKGEEAVGEESSRGSEWKRLVKEGL